MNDILLQAAMFLAVAAFAAPVARMAGLGSVLGYLLAGAALGPYGPLQHVMGYSAVETESLVHFAQIGIAFFLFLIGLELRPRRLWAMREGVFKGGVVQLLVTGPLLVGVIWTFLPTVSGSLGNLGPALLMGFALALSCTVFALQHLEERSELSASHGRLSFSILLFQDLAAIPLIALIPVFAFGFAAAEGLGVAGVVQGLAGLVLIVIMGRHVIDRLFQILAKTNVREAMTASALLIVIGITILMDAIGMSATLGAFVAGVLLANSPYRHQLRSDLEPFEAILIGVFFTAIGMSMNPRLLLADPVTILSAVAALLLVKGVVLYAIARWLGNTDRAARRVAILLSAGGEFSFVLFTAVQPFGILTRYDAQVLTLVVVLSMLATPFLIKLDDWLQSRRADEVAEEDDMPGNDGHVVIAGFGRVGQIVARILRAKRIPFTALDKDPEQVNFVNQFGNRIYYGDASRLSILEAAETHKARAFVLAIDNVEESLKTAQIVRRYFPHVPIFARARNRQHVHRLMDLGVKFIEREAFLSSLEITRDVLRGLGLPESEIRYIVDTFKEKDEAVLYEDYAHYTDMEKIRALNLKRSEELETLFALDAQALPGLNTGNELADAQTPPPPEPPPAPASGPPKAPGVRDHVTAAE
jgi:glutathione-regulated potassium-efflux system protein KefB